MRTAARGLVGVLAGLFLVTVPVAVIQAAQPPDTSDLQTPADAIAAGRELEADHHWAEAIQLYEAVLERWPVEDAANDRDRRDLEDLRYALRRSRVQFGIDRRYTDRSFSERMLRQTRSEALNLLEEVLVRVQMEYVTPVSAKRFIAHGTESLYMALGNPRFVKRHLAGADGDAIDRVKGILIRDYWNRPVGSRLEARSVVGSVCDVVRRELGIPDAAVIMEYVFGGCNALDEYSHLLTPDRYGDLTGSIQGEFVGIGIEMVAEPGRGMRLVRVLEDSPAEEGGLREGDYIEMIDGTDCRDFTTDEAAQLLRGVSGSEVTLGFRSQDRYREGTFRRRAVQVRSIIKVQMVDRKLGIGYLRQTGFQSSTVEELDAAISRLQKQGMKALIWDLRRNPGGLLDVAAQVLDRFIDGGVLVSTEGRSWDQNQTFSARSWETLDVPLVLLVDGESASASEIVAGAIQDHQRGTIVGRKTYGKWSVQSIIHMPGGTGLKLTTARFFSPKHRNYSGKGLSPHLEVQARDTGFRGSNPGDLSTDQDVAAAIEVLSRRFASSRDR